MACSFMQLFAVDAECIAMLCLCCFLMQFLWVERRMSKSENNEADTSYLKRLSPFEMLALLSVPAAFAILYFKDALL
jgi:hypothetical protein